MIGFITKNRFILTNSLNSTKPHFKFTAFLSSTALQSDPKGDTFTIAYLTSSCGITFDAAKRMSNYFHLKSADKPTQALNFFKSYGFSDSQISSIVRSAPKVLLADVDKTIKPKFDLFVSLGGPREAVLNIVCKCPKILMASVEKKLLPSLDCLKSLGVSSTELLNLLAGSNRMLMVASENVLAQNIEVLRDAGMPNLMIRRFVSMNCFSPIIPPYRFKKLVERALLMGFDPKKSNFGDAVNSFATISKDNWDSKVSLFKKWGWSDVEFLTAFKKQPRVMVISKVKINGVMDYLVNTMGIEASAIANFPTLLKYSLEKRIIPRCSVLQLLVSKGLLQKNKYNIFSVVSMTDKDFLLAFVDKYKESRFELMSMYSRVLSKSVRNPEPASNA